MRAPRRCRRALVPTVVPCTTSIWSRREPVSAPMRVSPCWIASDGSEGVEGSLKRLRRPSCSKTKSVKVPPVSTPTRMSPLLVNRYPAPPFIRSADRIKHNLHSITIFKSRRVFYARFSGPHRFANRDRESGKASRPATLAHPLGHVVLVHLYRTPCPRAGWRTPELTRFFNH